MGLHGGEPSEEQTFLVRPVNDLVRNYREYYREQSTQAFDSLFSCMLDYDFSSYREDIRRIFAMWREAKCVGDTSLLKSGGSTSGVPSTYEFGPNFRHIRLAIEGFLRMSYNKTILIGGSPGLEVVLYREEDNWPQFDMQVMCDWGNRVSVEKFFGLFEKTFSSHGPINLVALPALWLSLTYDPLFLDWADANSPKIGALVNTDSVKCFNKTKCRTRDQMIEWGSGANFYTCGMGRYHFLPTFFCASPSRCYNLLNVKKNERDFDDFLSIGDEVDVCGCGKPKPRFSFLPHRHNFPLNEEGEFVDFDEVYDLIPLRTTSLQIHQSLTGETEVFYSSRGGEDEPKGLIDHLRSLGVSKSTFTGGRYFSVGNKVPLFWRGGNPSFKDRR